MQVLRVMIRDHLSFLMFLMLQRNIENNYRGFRCPEKKHITHIYRKVHEPQVFELPFWGQNDEGIRQQVPRWSIIWAAGPERPPGLGGGELQAKKQNGDF